MRLAQIQIQLHNFLFGFTDLIDVLNFFFLLLCTHIRYISAHSCIGAHSYQSEMADELLLLLCGEYYNSLIVISMLINQNKKKRLYGMWWLRLRLSRYGNNYFYSIVFRRMAPSRDKQAQKIQKRTYRIGINACNAIGMWTFDYSVVAFFFLSAIDIVISVQLFIVLLSFRARRFVIFLRYT